MLVNKLNQSLTSELETVTLSKSIDFVYEEQCFNTALYLIKGYIFCYKKNYLVRNIYWPAAIGIDFILKNKSSPYRIHIVKNSKVIFLSKKEIEKRLVTNTC